MSNPSKIIGERIKYIREAQDLSIGELAEMSGVSRPYLHLLERGDGNPTHEKLLAIAHALGVLVSELNGELDSTEDLNRDIPASLRDFAERKNLSFADVLSLSKIEFRGKKPETVAEWDVLYTVLKGTLGSKE